MLDRHTQTLLRPVLNVAALVLVRAGVSADVLTWLGFVLGLTAAAAIALHAWMAALLLLLASRLLDGLDGAVARLTQPTDAGGFLDIALDFLFYAMIPLAFAVANPTANALPAAVLLGSFIGTGSSFLAFAAIAARQTSGDSAHGPKAFIYSTGLMEGAETIAFFILFCLFPSFFPTLAIIFAALCLLTVVQRFILAAKSFR